MTREPPLMRVHATYPPNTPQSFWRRNRHALWRSCLLYTSPAGTIHLTQLGRRRQRVVHKFAADHVGAMFPGRLLYTSRCV